MNTNAPKGPVVGNEFSLRPVQQAASVHDALLRRLMSLLDATMRETWLPMSFRALVVQEFPEIRSELLRRKSSFESIEPRIANLVAAADPYRTFAGRSEALVALRFLDAELRAVQIAA